MLWSFHCRSPGAPMRLITYIVVRPPYQSSDILQHISARHHSPIYYSSSLYHYRYLPFAIFISFCPLVHEASHILLNDDNLLLFPNNRKKLHPWAGHELGFEVSAAWGSAKSSAPMSLTNTVVPAYSTSSYDYDQVPSHCSFLFLFPPAEIHSLMYLRSRFGRKYLTKKPAPMSRPWAILCSLNLSAETLHPFT